jgi:hypothetical protein
MTRALIIILAALAIVSPAFAASAQDDLPHRVLECGGKLETVMGHNGFYGITCADRPLELDFTESTHAVNRWLEQVCREGQWCRVQVEATVDVEHINRYTVTDLLHVTNKPLFSWER